MFGPCSTCVLAKALMIGSEANARWSSMKPRLPQRWKGFFVSSGSGNENYYWIAVHFDQRSSVASKMAKLVTKEAFECDPDFCPRCGSILPLPGVSDVVSCILCDFKKDASGNTSQRSFVFKNSMRSWGTRFPPVSTYSEITLGRWSHSFERTILKIDSLDRRDESLW